MSGLCGFHLNAPAEPGRPSLLNHRHSSDFPPPGVFYLAITQRGALLRDDPPDCLRFRLGRNAVRIFALGLLFAAAPGLPAARAVTYPAVTVLPGQISQIVVSNLCYIVRGPTEFQRNNGANKASLTIAEMTADGFQLNGKVNLIFSDTNSGSANFDYAPSYPTDIQSVTFQNYSQTYNATTKLLTVHFKLSFPNCLLPVAAKYTFS